MAKLKYKPLSEYIICRAIKSGKKAEKLIQLPGDAKNEDTLMLFEHHPLVFEAIAVSDDVKDVKKGDLLVTNWQNRSVKDGVPAPYAEPIHGGDETLFNIRRCYVHAIWEKD